MAATEEPGFARVSGGGVTNCAWVRRDGSPCPQVAQVEGLCPAHFNMRRALEAENRERLRRGAPPLSERERDNFLKTLRRARKAAKQARRLESA